MAAGTGSGRSEEGNTESASLCSRLIATVPALTSAVWGSCLLRCSQQPARTVPSEAANHNLKVTQLFWPHRLRAVIYLGSMMKMFKIYIQMLIHYMSNKIITPEDWCSEFPESATL